MFGSKQFHQFYWFERYQTDYVEIDMLQWNFSVESSVALYWRTEGCYVKTFDKIKIMKKLQDVSLIG